MIDDGGNDEGGDDGEDSDNDVEEIGEENLEFYTIPITAPSTTLPS